MQCLTFFSFVILFPDYVGIYGRVLFVVIYVFNDLEVWIYKFFKVKKLRKSIKIKILHKR